MYWWLAEIHVDFFIFYLTTSVWVTHLHSMLLCSSQKDHLDMSP